MEVCIAGVSIEANNSVLVRQRGKAAAHSYNIVGYLQ